VPSRARSRELAAHQVDAGAEEARLILPRLNAEDLDQLSSSFCHCPMSDFGTTSRMRKPPSPFGPALCDDEPCLDRLAEADLVRQDAAPLLEPAERKDHRVDLMGLGSIRAC
jgi:hypothetical protein